MDLILLQIYLILISQGRLIHVGFASWGRNLKAGFPWGPMVWIKTDWHNFLGHPYSGGEYLSQPVRTDIISGNQFRLHFRYVICGKFSEKQEYSERNDLIWYNNWRALFGEISI